MGLLDDAIREHLDLKRKHGAPDDEVARAEQEALGPARREPAPEETLVDIGATAEPTAIEATDDVEPPPPPPPPPAEEDPVAVEPVAAEPVPDDEPLQDEPVAEEDPLSEQPAVDHEPHAPTRVLDDPLDESVAPLPSRPPADEGAADEDLLEETPDFLQETPEHDKLWFEQKPPRDFDFD